MSQTSEVTEEQIREAARVRLGAIYGLSRPLSKNKLESSYRLWLSELLPKHFRSADDAQFAPHHDRFFEWGWVIKRGTLSEPPACLWVVNRLGNKSTSTAGLLVALGAMQQRKFGLVITRTETQGDTHIGRVNSMLLASKIGSIYPGMTQPKLRKLENREVRLSWNRSILTTADDWTLQNFSLEAAARGVGLGEYRPDIIWVTDIDDEHDGPGRVDTLINALSASVLGTSSADCVVIFDQNLIHRDSVLSRILTRKSDVLSDRLTIGPVPAIYQPKYERKQEHWHVIEGRESWRGLPIPACEATLNRVGMDSWEREYQHNVTLAYKDAVYSAWDEAYHFITRSEFARYFERFGVKCQDAQGRWQMPEKGKIVMAQDWGNNPGHPCANAWAWRPSEGMPATIRRDVFFYREMCWPRFPLIEDDDRKHPSAMTVGAAIQDVEGQWESRRIQWRIASHERPEIVRGYLTDLPLTGRPAMAFTQINTARAREGITHMRNFLAIERDQQHPFRVYPVGHPSAGSPLMGKPRVYFIVGNDSECEACSALNYEQGSLYWDEAKSALATRPAIDEHGQARTAFEYPIYRKPDTAQGAEKKDPPKIDDDIIDCHRAIAGDLFPTMQRLTLDEKVELEMPEHVRREVVDAIPPGPEQDAAIQARYFQEHMAKSRVKRREEANSGLSVYEKSRLYKR